MPEFTQFDSVKSMMRYLPANGTAGLARRSPSRHSRLPTPPASTNANARGLITRPRTRRGSAARCRARSRPPRSRGDRRPRRSPPSARRALLVARQDRPALVAELETRLGRKQLEARAVVGADRVHVLPVAVELVRDHAYAGFEHGTQHVEHQVDRMATQRLAQHFGLEQ